MALQSARQGWFICLALGALLIFVLIEELRWAYPERPIREAFKNIAHGESPTATTEPPEEETSPSEAEFNEYMHIAANTEALAEIPPVPMKNKTTEEDKSKSILVILPKDESTGDMGFPEDWLGRAIENRRDFAAYHDYQFRWARLTDYQTEYEIQPVWAKVAALADAFERVPDVDWIWMLDSDAIILNATISLWDYVLSPEALNRTVIPGAEIKFPGRKNKIPAHDNTVRTPDVVVPEDIYFIIARDFNGINAGSFFVRRNSFMAALVDLWRDPYFMRADFTFYEQDTIAHLIITHPQILKHVGIVEQSLINDYPIGLYGDTGATPSSLAVHFAGCRSFSETCDQMFQEHWGNRTVVQPSADNHIVTTMAL